MLTDAQFLEFFPEFKSASLESRSWAITSAESWLGDAWAGENRLRVVALKAAALLALSPMGRNARKTDTGISTYQAELDLEMCAMACAFRRI